MTNIRGLQKRVSIALAQWKELLESLNVTVRTFWNLEPVPRARSHSSVFTDPDINFASLRVRQCGKRPSQFRRCNSNVFDIRKMPLPNRNDFVALSFGNLYD